MEFRHIRYFAAVAEEENITRAALKLHVSQPSLSRQMRELEGELGVTLLERSPKSVRLTEVGRLFHEEARAVLDRVQAAVEKVRAAEFKQSLRRPGDETGTRRNAELTRR